MSSQGVDPSPKRTDPVTDLTDRLRSMLIAAPDTFRQVAKEVHVWRNGGFSYHVKFGCQGALDGYCVELKAPINREQAKEFRNPWGTISVGPNDWELIRYEHESRTCSHTTQTPCPLRDRACILSHAWTTLARLYPGRDGTQQWPHSAERLAALDVCLICSDPIGGWGRALCQSTACEQLLADFVSCACAHRLLPDLLPADIARQIDNLMVRLVMQSVPASIA